MLEIVFALSSFERIISQICTLKTTQKKLKCINFNQWSTRQCKQRFNEHFRIQKHRHHNEDEPRCNVKMKILLSAKFEQCVIDNMILYGKTKVKLQRAYGGCLGVSSR